jgi:hypothetical protein
MRTTVIPAQVTTVEDTIAGNLTLTQIILLIIPVLLSTAIYAVFPEKMVFSAYKIPLIFITSFIFVSLSLRIKGRLVLNWLVVLSSFILRPHIYIFDKNTLFSRPIVAQTKPEKRKIVIKVTTKASTDKASSNLVRDYAPLLRDTDINIRFTRKGLLVVKNL